MAPRWAQWRVERPRALIVLVSYIGAQERHIEKYATLLNGLRCDVLAVFPPPLLLWLPHSAARLAAQLLARIADWRAQHLRLPFLLFSFSGGPKAVTYKLLQLLEASDLRFALAGEAYDSGPADFRSAAGLRLLAPSGSGAARRAAARASRYLLDAALGAYFERERETYWATLASGGGDRPGAPVLILHSADDALCESEPVAAFEAALHARGRRDVTRRCWAQSEHVQHLRRHPEEYGRLVGGWLERAIAAWPPRAEVSQMGAEGRETKTQTQPPRARL